jgi:predicted 2-oxoglutarate/Fe(II)-dependent dioxygenase YbiX
MSAKFDYIVWNNFLEKEQAIDLNKFIENNFNFYEPKDWGAKTDNGEYKKDSKVKIIKWKKIKNLLNNLEQQILYANQQNFGYDINFIFEEQNCFFNIYSSENLSNYDWHTDRSSNELTDIKLTMLLNLSTESYEGGEFQLNYSGEVKTIENFKKCGDMILFKSHILHKVLPTKKGIRKTLAIFFEGPNFR